MIERYLLNLLAIIIWIFVGYFLKKYVFFHTISSSIEEEHWKREEQKKIKNKKYEKTFSQN